MDKEYTMPIYLYYYQYFLISTITILFIPPIFKMCVFILIVRSSCMYRWDYTQQYSGEFRSFQSLLAFIGSSTYSADSQLVNFWKVANY